MQPSSSGLFITCAYFAAEGERKTKKKDGETQIDTDIDRPRQRERERTSMRRETRGADLLLPLLSCSLALSHLSHICLAARCTDSPPARVLPRVERRTRESQTRTYHTYEHTRVFYTRKISPYACTCTESPDSVRSRPLVTPTRLTTETCHPYTRTYT